MEKGEKEKKGYDPDSNVPKIMDYIRKEDARNLRRLLQRFRREGFADKYCNYTGNKQVE